MGSRVTRVFHSQWDSVVRRPTYALSLKQPWAGLLASGRKTVEVRKWATTFRGRLYIHASRGSDRRPEAWAHVTDDVRPLTERTGGVIGAAELTACFLYRTSVGFVTDAHRHLNAPNWFTPPRMYGFEFQNAFLLPYFACKGSIRVFSIELPEAA
jgi:hypothetical protein